MSPDTMREIRKSLNASQEWTAELIGVTRQSVTKWEQGAKRVPERAVRVYEALAWCASDLEGRYVWTAVHTAARLVSPAAALGLLLYRFHRPALERMDAKSVLKNAGL